MLTLFAVPCRQDTMSRTVLMRESFFTLHTSLWWGLTSSRVSVCTQSKIMEGVLMLASQCRHWVSVLYIHIYMWILIQVKFIPFPIHLLNKLIPPSWSYLLIVGVLIWKVLDWNRNASTLIQCSGSDQRSEYRRLFYLHLQQCLHNWLSKRQENWSSKYIILIQWPKAVYGSLVDQLANFIDFSFMVKVFNLAKVLKCVNHPLQRCTHLSLMDEYFITVFASEGVSREWGSPIAQSSSGWEEVIHTDTCYHITIHRHAVQQGGVASHHMQMLRSRNI